MRHSAQPEATKTSTYAQHDNETVPLRPPPDSLRNQILQTMLLTSRSIKVKLLDVMSPSANNDGVMQTLMFRGLQLSKNQSF
jgi:hypothetical protein